MKFFRQLKEAVFERVAGNKAGTILGQFWFDTALGQPKINDGAVVKVFIVTDDSNAIPINDQTTDGSWRIIIIGAELKMQRRELGAWVTKGGF